MAGFTARIVALEIGQHITLPLSEYNRWWQARDRAIHCHNMNISWEKTAEGYVLCRLA